MKLEYQLSEEDFLELVLFDDSKNLTTKKAGQKASFMLMFAFIGLGYILFHTDKVIAYSFFVFGVVTFFAYPFYLKSFQKKRYRSYIQRVYKYRFGRVVQVAINDTYIEQNDSSGEFKFNLTELDVIYETQMNFYLKMRSGGSLIIPKNKIADQLESVKEELVMLANKLKINYEKDLNWKW